MPNNSQKPSEEEFSKLVKEFIHKHPAAVKAFLNSPNVKEILEEEEKDSTNNSSPS